MKDQIPAHCPSVVTSVNDAFEEYTSDFQEVTTITRYEHEKALENFLNKDESYKVDHSKKYGRLVYNVNWNMVVNLYKKRQKNESSEVNLGQTGNSPYVRPNELFHSVSEIRRRLKDGFKICDL